MTQLAPTVGKTESRAERLWTELKSFDSDASYYAIALGAVGGQITVSVDTHFVGWPDDVPGPVEVRQASIVDPEILTGIWNDLSMPWIAVSSRLHMAVYFRSGGNALVEVGVAHEFFKPSVEPHPVVSVGPFGFVGGPPGSRSMRGERPRPKHRRRILDRDNWQCRLCCRGDADGVELQIHHIRKASNGGPTVDENLLTLCRECHEGREPHEDLDLYYLPGGQMDRVLGTSSGEAHRELVEAYRNRIAAAFRRRLNPPA
jgi:hypothetical protein